VTTPQHLTSLLVRLEHANALELGDSLQELLGYPDVLDQVVQIIDSRIDVGAYVPDEPLASLISQTRSSRLYEKVRERLLKNHWTVLRFKRVNIPIRKLKRSYAVGFLRSHQTTVSPSVGSLLTQCVRSGQRRYYPHVGSNTL
jgi:hypothetical protein